MSGGEKMRMKRGWNSWSSDSEKLVLVSQVKQGDEQIESATRQSIEWNRDCKGVREGPGGGGARESEGTRGIGEGQVATP